MKKKDFSVQKIKTQKVVKKSGFFRFLRTRYGVFICLSIFIFLSAFCLFLMDTNNTFRHKYFPYLDNITFFKDFFKLFKVKYVDGVSLTTWFFFFVGFGISYTGFIIWCFFAPIKKKIVYKEKYTQKIIDRKRTIYNLVFFGLMIAIIGVIAYFIYRIFPWKAMKWSDLTLDNFVNFLHCLGILMLLFAIPVTALLIIILIFKLLVLVAVFFAGSVSKGVMKTQGYQEALATSQIINQKLQEETLKAMNKNTPVVVTKDVSQHVGDMINSGEYGAYQTNPKYISLDALGGLPQMSKKPDFVFPALSAIDNQYKNKKHVVAGVITTSSNKKSKTVKESNTKKLTPLNDPKNKLKDFAPRFQAYLANRHKLYYSLDIIRYFTAGLNASRIILLEGLSGTGKTTLPRVFSEFIDGKSSFFPVQSTWRDRSDIIGYYSDFSKQFKETEFLKTLYEGIYNPDYFNFMVLDEMNISRVEYYFADFLSILEYPSSEWLVPLINTNIKEKLPIKLEDGKIRVPLNTWFVGTINIDDSTFTVSDKVYDRVIVLDFEELSMPFTSKENDEPWPMTPHQLFECFEYASKNPMYNLTQAEKTKFIKLCDFASEIFDIKFGNRIFNQVMNFVPAYLALGGSKIGALDFMFAKKILRKIEGKYESYISVGLAKLSKYIQSAYGKGHFKLTEEYINKTRKKLA